MHDLHLIGVHDDGEHLVLSDAEGQRFLLGVDEALRAAVRRDRAALGQLQIEIGGGLRPREVQARIRAGASAEQVASTSGWPLEKVRRYEGPVLAEREHIASLARGVRLRRRGTEQVTLGAEVTRRLTGRGVGSELVGWDSWRTDEGPWTVVVTFTAGGRERQARWHFDLGARAVVPADDEARWLSEAAPEGDSPLGSTRLAAVPTGSVYDIEADGGVDGIEGVDRGPDDRPGHEHPLDLMTAMRSRRRERDQRSGKRGHGAVGPTDVPGAAHPSRRRRAPAAEPLELDPTLLADPPAAHPPASDPDDIEPLTPADLPADVTVDVDVDVDVDMDDNPDVDVPEPALARPFPLADQLREPVIDLVASHDHHADHADFGDDEPSADQAPDSPADLGSVEQDEAAESGRHRGAARPRKNRASVPSWDDIMFGAKRD